jgi:Curli production assembly/transport component CsgG
MSMRNPLRFVMVLLLAAALQPLPASAQNLDTELAALAEALAKQIKEAGLKKISVVDFSDLQGNYNELGRFIAENLTVNMVAHRKDFSMVDRANLKRILEENKLSMAGLVDPANAKKLAEISGVDALIIGNVTPLKTDVSITAKITSTATVEIVGAGRGSIRRGEEIDQLLDRGIANTADNTGSSGPSGSSVSSRKEFSASATTQKFRDFEVQLLSFKILPNGVGFAALQVNNTSKQTIGLAGNLYNDRGRFLISAKLLDEKGNFVRCIKLDGLTVGIADSGHLETSYKCVLYDLQSRNTTWLKRMIEIRPSESQRFTLEFGHDRNSSRDDPPKLGTIFKLQLELISTQIKENDDRPVPRLESFYLDNITLTPTAAIRP